MASEGLTLCVQFDNTHYFPSIYVVATLANGSLAASRIINWARSPKAVVHIFLKFGVDVPYSRIQVSHPH